MNTKKAAGGHATQAESMDVAAYGALATWAETADISGTAKITKAAGPGAGMALLEAAMGSPASVRRAVGKSSLSEKGSSPSRSVRLPAEMDAQLLAVASKTNLMPSEIIRRALGEYLAKAS